MELREGHVVVRVVALPVLQRLHQHGQGLLVLAQVLLGDAHVPEVVLLGLLVAGNLHGRLEVLLRLLVLPQHVVDRAEVVQCGGVRGRPLGHLLEQHSRLLLPRLLAAERGAVLEPLHVPGQATLHAVGLGGCIHRVGLVHGVVLQVRHGEVQRSLEDLWVAEAVLGVRHPLGVVRLVALEHPEVLLRAGHVVVLRPNEVRFLDGRLGRGPPDLVGAGVRGHHRAQDHRQSLELVDVAVEHALGEAGASRLDRVRVDVGAPDQGPGELRVHRRELDGAGSQTLPQWNPGAMGPEGKWHALPMQDAE
mmetsp:Transcript_149723/g.462276  ORF Transcript_149723/g.462276 Transcript_149723/m.462276 type:complete len:306 (+) Transcript_149723:688-1605(+)